MGDQVLRHVLRPQRHRVLQQLGIACRDHGGQASLPRQGYCDPCLSPARPCPQQGSGVSETTRRPQRAQHAQHAPCRWPAHLPVRRSCTSARRGWTPAPPAGRATLIGPSECSGEEATPPSRVAALHGSSGRVQRDQQQDSTLTITMTDALPPRRHLEVHALLALYNADELGRHDAALRRQQQRCAMRLGVAGWSTPRQTGRELSPQAASCTHSPPCAGGGLATLSC